MKSYKNIQKKNGLFVRLENIRFVFTLKPNNGNVKDPVIFPQAKMQNSKLLKKKKSFESKLFKDRCLLCVDFEWLSIVLNEYRGCGNRFHELATIPIAVSLFRWKYYFFSKVSFVGKFLFLLFLLNIFIIFCNINVTCNND